MAVDTPEYRKADMAVGGRLDEYLAGYRDAGHKREHIMRLLYAEHGLSLSGGTIERYIAALPDTAPDDTPKVATG
jgi:hypothetical protein